jgi:hypothetical protein
MHPGLSKKNMEKKRRRKSAAGQIFYATKCAQARIFDQVLMGTLSY